MEYGWEGYDLIKTDGMKWIKDTKHMGQIKEDVQCMCVVGEQESLAGPPAQELGLGLGIGGS